MINWRSNSSCYQLNLPLSNECASTFNLEKAICNHGLFMMAPNYWIPETKTLLRPLRLAAVTDHDTSVMVSISHPTTSTTTTPPPPLCIRIYSDQVPSSNDRQSILNQVSRMLRISERDEMSAREFYKLHPRAQEQGFARIFRSPTLFEDVVKSILLCSCRWKRTLEMAEALCKIQPELRRRNTILLKKQAHTTSLKRKRTQAFEDQEELQLQSSVENFPSPKELASVDKEFLEKKCNLGYRADYIIEFAKLVVSNTFDLDKFEQAASSNCSMSYEEAYKEFCNIKGFGPFVSANILMCIGCYERVPQDSETVRHLQQYHQRKDCKSKTCKAIIHQVYGKYAPFQCLAYWLELVEGYEEKCGRLSQLPRSSYGDVTGSKTKPSVSEAYESLGENRN